MSVYGFILVYYESIKRELSKRLICECRCDKTACLYQVKFISRRIKKDEGQGKEKCHAKSMMSKEVNERGLKVV